LALLDVKKAAEMFKQVGTPLLGVIENMSFFVCTHCGQATEIFRRGGGQKESMRLGIPLLGHIPLDPTVCDAGDLGVPVTIGQADTKAGSAFHRIAASLIEILSNRPEQHVVKIVN
jgi:ATP-binding protein involved in chromosome partitioning